MAKLKGHFPQQSEAGSIVGQIPAEYMAAFVESLLPMVRSKEEAAIKMHRERPSEIGRQRLLEMGIDPDNLPPE